MDLQEFSLLTTEIRLLMLMLIKVHARAMEEYFRERGGQISPVQFGIMRNLLSRPHTISELSKIMVLDPSTLVAVVDDLEIKGLVERRKDPSDRRRTPLSVTETGRALLYDYHDHPLRDEMQRCIMALGEERAEQLRGLLREILSGMPDGPVIAASIHENVFRREGELGAAPADADDSGRCTYDT
jgi:DNA-binding MarR family transcriptional regulator